MPNLLAIEETYLRDRVLAPFEGSLRFFPPVRESGKKRSSMLREIEKAVEALKQVPERYRELVLEEASGKKRKKPGPAAATTGTRKKPGPKPGWKKRKKPGPKPGAKARREVEVAGSDKAPVKVSPEKLAKLAKLRGAK